MDVSPSYTWTNHEYDDPIIHNYTHIFIYIYIISKYTIPTIQNPSQKIHHLPTTTPSRFLAWCYFYLNKIQVARFNGLPVFTERTPSPPHLPFGTLEVVVDEVLFLEHLTSRWLKASQGPKQEGTNQHARSWVLGFCCEKKRDQQKCHHLQMRDELMSWKRTMASWKNGSWMYPLVNWDSWLETGPFDLKMYFLLKIVIFQPAMLVYQRVVGKKARNIQELLVFFWEKHWTKIHHLNTSSANYVSLPEGSWKTCFSF